MTRLLSSRGCVYCVSRGGGGGGGAYAIAGLATGGCPPILITGVQMRDQDLVAPVTTLRQTKVLYVFGQAFGSVSVLGTALLGPTGLGQMERVVSFVRQSRVSNSMGPVNVSFPGGTVAAYLVGMTLMPADAEFGIQPFSLECTTASPP